MAIRYTQPFLTKLEGLLAEAGYQVRYEKGTFNSGYCLLKDTRIAVVNKYFPLEGRINALADILRAIPVEAAQLSEKNRQLYDILRTATPAAATTEPETEE